MSRFILLLGYLFLGSMPTWGQCVISKNNYGQVITTCEQYGATVPNQFATASHKQANYLGSEFFTFPAWQAGKIQLDQSGKEIACLLAYNLVTNTIMCQFNNELKPTNIKPYTFTINGIKFSQQVNMVPGVDKQSYFTVLYDGQTKLMKSFTNRLILKPTGNGYEKSNPFDGYYQTQERYYIRKGEGQPQLTTLSRSSLSTILYEHSEQIVSRFPQKQLTIGETTKLLAYYDSLRTASNSLKTALDSNKPLLSRDVVFTDFLHNQLKYPNRAWNNSVYGRVYAGFEVNEDGRITNITLLSPDNIGFGFDQAVKLVLSKLANVRPTHVGKYALPVSFTYTNTQDKEGTYVPINTLPSERFNGRTVLEEIVVPVVVSKSVTTSREVWGYYK